MFKESIYLIPEILMTLTILGIVLGEIAHHGERIRLVFLIVAFGLGASFFQVFLTSNGINHSLFKGSISIDVVSFFFRLLFIGIAFFAAMLTSQSKELRSDVRAEYYAMIVVFAFAANIASMATDLVLIFLALQLFNYASYFLMGYSRVILGKKLLTTEASVKFLYMSLLSVVFFLVGSIFLFVHTGSLNLSEIRQQVISGGVPPEVLYLSWACYLISVLFYIGAFPVFLWIADVLSGVTAPTALILAVGVPAVGIVVFIRVLFSIAVNSSGVNEGEFSLLSQYHWSEFVAFFSGVTMVLGGSLAFFQTRLKRLIAFLVVSQAGFYLSGFLIFDPRGISLLFYHLLTQSFALLGVYCAYSAIFDGTQKDELKDLGGLIRRAAPECIALLLFLGAFIGLPPLSGFVSKSLLVGEIVREEGYILASIAIGSNVIMVAAYAKLAYGLIGRSSVLSSAAFSVSRRPLLYFLVAPVLMLSVVPSWLMRWAEKSLSMILW